MDDFTWGIPPTQIVNIAIKFSFTSSPNKSKTTVKKFFWFIYNLALLNWTKKHIVFKLFEASLKVFSILLVINMPYFIHFVSSNNGVSIIWIGGNPFIPFILYTLTSEVWDIDWDVPNVSWIISYLKLSSICTPKT